MNEHLPRHRLRNVLGLSLLSALLALPLLAAPASGWFATSTSFTYTITTASWVDQDDPDGSDPDEDEPDPDDPDTDLVWVCKLTGEPDTPTVKRGPNPIQVSAAATTDGRLNDEHGSPVVSDEGADCGAILDPEPEAPLEAPAEARTPEGGGQEPISEPDNAQAGDAERDPPGEDATFQEENAATDNSGPAVE